MTDLSEIKALTFDIGGTVFDWRGAIEDEVRRLAEARGADVDVRQFATDWRRGMFAMLARVRTGELPWMNADQLHRRMLDDVLAVHTGLDLSDSERDELNEVWHRLKGVAGRRGRDSQAPKPLQSSRADRLELVYRHRLLSAQRHRLGRHTLVRVPGPLQVGPSRVLVGGQAAEAGAVAGDDGRRAHERSPCGDGDRDAVGVCPPGGRKSGDVRDRRGHRANVRLRR